MPIYKMDGKKDGQQKYRVRINYTDKFGKQKQIDRTAVGSMEAKMLEMSLLKEIKDTNPSANITLEELYDQYIIVIKHEIRESSLDKSSRVLKLYVLPHLKNYKLDKLTLPVLQEWKMTMLKLELSTRTRQNIYSTFRALLNFGVKYGYLNSNPLKNIDNFKNAYDTPIKDKLCYYTKEQFLKFIAMAKESADANAYYDFYVFFNIAYYTGMRKGEIHALKWSDIEGNLIHVRRSITQKLKGEDRETPPKNKTSYRTLQMPLPLIDILEEHKKVLKNNKGFLKSNRICGGDKPLRDSTLENKNKEYAKSAGIEKIRIHDFRHSHVSLLANAGINIQEIARRLGHSKIEITWNTYSHMYPREEEKAIEVLNLIK